MFKQWFYSKPSGIFIYFGFRTGASIPKYWCEFFRLLVPVNLNTGASRFSKRRDRFKNQDNYYCPGSLVRSDCVLDLYHSWCKFSKKWNETKNTFFDQSERGGLKVDDVEWEWRNGEPFDFSRGIPFPCGFQNMIGWKFEISPEDEGASGFHWKWYGC